MTPTTTAAPARHRARGNQSWQDDAACRPTPCNLVDPEWFFPAPDEFDKIHAAKGLCKQCPVRRTCLEAALETGDIYGIRGGLTEEEREPLHEQAAHRLDASRVSAALSGRDIHLSKAERRAVVLAAYRQGVSEERLAWLLHITEEHAQKLYRKARRILRHREAKDMPPPVPEAGERVQRGEYGTAA